MIAHRHRRLSAHRQLRALGVTMALPFRAGTWRPVAAIGLTATSQLAVTVTAVAVKVVVDAVRADDGGRLALGLLAFGLTIVVSRGGDTAAWILKQGMNERTELVVDTELATLTAGLVGVEHFERTEHLDDLELLRVEHQNLSQLPDQIATGGAIAVRLVITLGVLITVDARLALLPLFALPSIAASWRTQRRDRAAWDSVAPSWRLQGAWFDLSRSDAAGREARVFGLRDHLIGRFRRFNGDVDTALTRAYIRGAVEDVGGRILFGVAYVGALFLVAREAISGRTTPGDLAMVLVLSADLNAQVTAVASVLSAPPGRCTPRSGCSGSVTTRRPTTRDQSEAARPPPTASLTASASAR